MDIQQTVFNCKQIIFFTFFLMALSVFLTVSKSADAYDSSLFVVEGIRGDVTADDAVNAQEQAFWQAQLRAFDILANRLVSETDAPSMVRPDASMIASMIKDYEVSNEQISAVRYVGDFTFRFDPKSLSNYFSITGVQYTDTRSKPLLILPIFQKNGRNTIWGDENIWLRSWASTTFPTALVPVEVPIGDLDDVADINDDNVLRFERKSLDRMLLRYNAKEAAIMIALPDKTLEARTLEQNAAGLLQVSIYRTDRGSAEYVSDFCLKPEAEESVEKFYKRAMLRGFQALQKNWKRRTAASAAQSRLYYVRMPVNGLGELVEAQDVLRTLPGLNAVSVVSVKPVEVRLLLTFRGDETRLREALRSGSSYLLSRAYGKDEQAHKASSEQIEGLNVMYDLYHRSKAAKMRQAAQYYASPPSQPFKPLKAKEETIFSPVDALPTDFQKHDFKKGQIHNF
ncbi:MAG: DUF2066 domain-containing protein [Alphaproteobacteria bacterium]|nr:DUF2066 domain-containing protein [Alphaproteobacteria bacterium]